MCPSVVPRITGVEGPVTSDQRKIRNGAVESDEIAECSESFLTRYIPKISTIPLFQGITWNPTRKATASKMKPIKLGSSKSNCSCLLIPYPKIIPCCSWSFVHFHQRILHLSPRFFSIPYHLSPISTASQCTWARRFFLFFFFLCPLSAMLYRCATIALHDRGHRK